MTLGLTLRQARESEGLGLDKLCSELKLKKELLITLENGQYENLPEKPYVRAVLVTLARRFNLDPEKIVRMFYKEAGLEQDGIGVRGGTEKITIDTKSSRKAPVIIIICLVIIFLAVYFNLMEKEQVSDFASQGKQPPDSASALVEGTADDPDTSQQLKQAVELIKEEVPEIDMKEKMLAASAAPEQKPVGMAKDQKMTPPVTAKPEKKKSIPAGKKLVVLKCVTDSVWVNIKRNGKREVNRLLLRNQTWRVRYRDTIFIVSGVFNGLELTTAGKVYRPKATRLKIVNGRIVK
ncbi:helix-turn-helix domain-containing protein [Fibrobacterota bacterium]